MQNTKKLGVLLSQQKKERNILLDSRKLRNNDVADCES